MYLTEEQLDIACAAVQFAINNKPAFDKYLEEQGHKDTVKPVEFMDRVRIVISDELHLTRDPQELPLEVRKIGSYLSNR